MSTPVPVISAQLPSNFECIITNANWQALVNLLSVTCPDGNVLKQSVEPAPDQRDKIWLRLNNDGTPDRVYVYAGGKWLSKHAAFEGQVVMWEGAEGDIPTIDGGTVGAVTTTSGPFWEKVSEMDAKIPIGPGTTDAPTSTVIAVGDEGGSELVVLEKEQLPSNPFGVNNVTGPFLDVTAGGTFEVQTNPGTNHRVGGWDGNDEGHNNMPPYRGIWFIRKTSRLYYTAP